MHPTVIYTLVRQADWQAAEAQGHYEGSADDRADGFLHFSTAEHLRESARRHRAGEQDLLLVAVGTENLGAALKWELAPKRGAHFPHLYEPLQMQHVLSVTPVPLGADGQHRFPEEIPG